MHTHPPLQHEPWLSACAEQVEIDRDNRERERSEEARREKFQRDALKIRETLDDDRSKRIEVCESRASECGCVSLSVLVVMELGRSEGCGERWR